MKISGRKTRERKNIRKRRNNKDLAGERGLVGLKNSKKGNAGQVKK